MWNLQFENLAVFSLYKKTCEYWSSCCLIRLKVWNSFRTFWFTHVLCSLMYLLLGHVNLWRQYLTLITTWLDLFYSPSAYRHIVGMMRSSFYRNIQPCYVETNSNDKVFLSLLSTTRIISKQNFRKLISSAPTSINEQEDASQHGATRSINRIRSWVSGPSKVSFVKRITLTFQVMINARQWIKE